MAVPEHIETHTQAPDESVYAERGAHVQLVKIGLGKETLAVVILLCVVIGACGLIMGLNLAKQDQMDRDFRDLATRDKLLERRYVDMEAYAMLNGWKIPSDDMHGPTGNLQRMVPQEKANGRR